MGRSRSRSRSRSRGRRDEGKGGGKGDYGGSGEVVKQYKFKNDVAAYDEQDNEALKAVKAAIATLPSETQEPLKQLFTSSGLSLMDLDVKAIVGLAQLHVALQKKVMQHLEQEKVFLCNSRSKARFLSSACERAKQGALDVRGFGAIDPWKNHLNALGQKIPKIISFEHEEDWLEKIGERHHNAQEVLITFEVDVSEDPILLEKYADNNGRATYKVKIMDTSYDLKKEIEKDGGKIPLTRMKLHEGRVLGFLKDVHSFAYYNTEPDTPVELKLSEKIRGGSRKRRDMSNNVPYPKTRPHIAQLAGMKAPGMMVGKAPAPMMSMMAKMPGMMSGMNPMAMMAKMAPLMAKLMAAKGIQLPNAPKAS